MTKHIVTPKLEYSVGELSALLLRRLHHDIGDALGQAEQTAQFLPDMIDDHDRHKWLSRSVGLNVSHARSIHYAIQNLGGSKTSPNGYGELKGLVKRLADYANEKMSGVETVITQVDDIRMTQFMHLMYAEIWNYLTNARDAYPKPEEQTTNTIELSAVRTSLSSEQREYLGEHAAKYDPRDTYVVISVTDQAGGIEDWMLPQIFEKDISSKKGHSGIGLALTKRTLHQLNGFLEVDTQVDQGSTFSLYVPQEYKK